MELDSTAVERSHRRVGTDITHLYALSIAVSYLGIYGLGFDLFRPSNAVYIGLWEGTQRATLVDCKRDQRRNGYGRKVHKLCYASDSNPSDCYLELSEETRG